MFGHCIHVFSRVYCTFFNKYVHVGYSTCVSALKHTKSDVHFTPNIRVDDFTLLLVHGKVYHQTIHLFHHYIIGILTICQLSTPVPKPDLALKPSHCHSRCSGHTLQVTSVHLSFGHMSCHSMKCKHRRKAYQPPATCIEPVAPPAIASPAPVIAFTIVPFQSYPSSQTLLSVLDWVYPGGFQKAGGTHITYLYTCLVPAPVVVAGRLSGHPMATNWQTWI